MEESTVVNEWIAESKGGTLLRLATKRFGPTPAEVEKAFQAITDPYRLCHPLESDPAVVKRVDALFAQGGALAGIEK